MLLKARVWSLGKLLLLVAALAGTFLLFALVSMRVALRARDVEVPNLVGATVENATLTVNDLGLARRPQVQACQSFSNFCLPLGHDYFP